MKKKGKDTEVVGGEVVEADKDIEVGTREMIEEVEVGEVEELTKIREVGVVAEMIELIGTEITNRDNKLVIIRGQENTEDQEWRITKLNGKQEPQYYNICKYKYNK